MEAGPAVRSSVGAVFRVMVREGLLWGSGGASGESWPQRAVCADEKGQGAACLQVGAWG